MSGRKFTSKQECVTQLLDQGKVFIQLDPRVEGVDVPPQFAQQPVLGLNLSWRFGLETFEVTALGVRAGLSFQGERDLCVIPWAAVFAVAREGTDEVYIFPDSLPPERRAKGSKASPGEPGESTEGDAEPPSPPPPKRARPQLRLVK